MIEIFNVLAGFSRFRNIKKMIFKIIKTNVNTKINNRNSEESFLDVLDVVENSK